MRAPQIVTSPHTLLPSGAVALPDHLRAAVSPNCPNFLLHHEHRIGAPEGVLNALPGAGIVDPLAIHDKSILVAPCWQPYRRFPHSSRARAQRRPLHIPVIESPGYRHRSGLQHVESEFNWLLHGPLARPRALGRYGPRNRGGPTMSRLHHKLTSITLSLHPKAGQCP